MSAVNGVYECVDIMFFVLILGDCLALITCEMVKVPYVKYVKFLMPLLGFLTILGIVMLLLQATFS